MNTEYSVTFHKIVNGEVRADQELIFDTLKEAFTSVRRYLKRNNIRLLTCTRKRDIGAVITTNHKVEDAIITSLFHIRVLN